ncbi:MAG: cellulose synthase/poly-beta-1,6-N-acetylglucosamine synthase-like glycosyltransferase [Candidatus Paceibacteria bacterium]|jgi:cellulose synthase/poly-beta-1,6-N-acetylglucosamine synthase-like glycosyltransferase/exo-beta-1,3-glucanase (GH17 family)
MNLVKIKHSITIFSLSVLLLLTISYINRTPENIPPIPELNCLSYDPMPGNTDKRQFEKIDKEQINKDLGVLSEYTNCVRLYTVGRGLSYVYEYAKHHKIDVIMGINISGNEERDIEEISLATSILGKGYKPKLIVVGNETLTFNVVSLEYLTLNINKVQQTTSVPVTTAELPRIWRNIPELASHVDYIGLHLLPYWYGLDIDKGLEKIKEEYTEFSIEFNKPVYVLETGWPTLGPSRHNAKPSLRNQRLFINNFVNYANNESISYNIIELYDQRWKVHSTEGRVGAHWGILTETLEDKESSQKDEKINLLLFVLILYILTLFFVGIRNFFRHDILIHTVLVILSLSIGVVFSSIKSEFLLTSPIVTLVFFPSLTIVIMTTLYYIRGFTLLNLKEKNHKHKHKNTNQLVSIHIPCRDETPKQVIDAVKSCMDLDYKNIEVIIIDNNSTNPKNWKPVEKFVKRTSDSRIFFYQVSKLSGYKAGALNYALSKTNPKAKYIAVIDSDYIVKKEWISDSLNLIGGKIKAVQAPQHYRCITNNFIERAASLEQDIFAATEMRIRGDKSINATILHGTMCVIDKQALDDLGGWNKSTICEDTELGLRLLKSGWDILFIPKPLGSGIAPQTLSSLMKQRMRWVVGAVEILKIHKWLLFNNLKSLKLTQRYYFIGGWLFWLSHIFYPIFIIGSLAGTYLIIVDSRYFPPGTLYLSASIFMIVFVLFAIFIKKRELNYSILDGVILMIISISMTPIISLSIVKGLLFSKSKFVVTKKITSSSNSPEILVFSLFFISLAGVQIYFLLEKYGLLDLKIILIVLSTIILYMPFLSIIGICFYERLKS